MKRMYVPQRGDLVRFTRDYHAPISNYELLIPLDSTGMVMQVREKSRFTFLKLDTHYADLDEWDNCLQFNPDMYGTPETDRRLDQIAMIHDMATMLEVTNRADAIIEVKEHLTKEDIFNWMRLAGKGVEECPFCGNKEYTAIGGIEPDMGLAPGDDRIINPLECLRCLRRWNEILRVENIEEAEGENP